VRSNQRRRGHKQHRVAFADGGTAERNGQVRLAEWGNVFGDPVVATAILDRLLHHSQVITIRGDSYRLREKRRSGLIKAIVSDAAAA
jgi:hypothetical protein